MAQSCNPLHLYPEVSLDARDGGECPRCGEDYYPLRVPTRLTRGYVYVCIDCPYTEFSRAYREDSEESVKSPAWPYRVWWEYENDVPEGQMELECGC